MIDINEFPMMKKWIEEHIDLIQNENFREIYSNKHNIDTPILTQILLSAGIDPLSKLTFIPENYLAESDITTFTVPGHIDSIKNSAFWNCECLQTVKLHDDITFIGDSAFCECYNLTNINLPKNLEYIQDDAFAETNLKHVVIPDFVGVISKHAFEECKQLETVRLGQSVKIIGSRAFGNCSKLYYVMLNSELEKISDYSFKECKALEEIYIPDSVRDISVRAFYNCDDLRIICSEDSFAHKYAIDYGFDCKLI